MAIPLGPPPPYVAVDVVPQSVPAQQEPEGVQNNNQPPPLTECARLKITTSNLIRIFSIIFLSAARGVGSDVLKYSSLTLAISFAVIRVKNRQTSLVTKTALACISAGSAGSYAYFLGRYRENEAASAMIGIIASVVVLVGSFIRLQRK